MNSRGSNNNVWAVSGTFNQRMEWWWKFQLPETFFNDRSKTFESIKKATEIASSFSPIDIAQIVSIENNDGLSTNEISSELVEILEKKYDKKIILFLDDYQFVDSVTNELLVIY